MKTIAAGTDAVVSGRQSEPITPLPPEGVIDLVVGLPGPDGQVRLIGGDPGMSDGYRRHGAGPTPGPVRNNAPATGKDSRRSAKFRHTRVDYSTAGSGRPYVASR